jgi:hypothetical protein
VDTDLGTVAAGRARDAAMSTLVRALVRSGLCVTTLAVLVGCRLDPGPEADAGTFARFEQSCARAWERVQPGSAHGEVIVFHAYEDSDFLGDALRPKPVFDPQYAHGPLAKALLLPPQALSRVRVRYTLPRCPRGPFAVDATRPREVQTLTSCPAAPRESGAQPGSIVTVVYEPADADGIRPFTLRLTDEATGRVLAEQHSWQLELGALKSNANRKFGYAGFFQYGRSCRLTPPDLLIKRALARE